MATKINEKNITYDEIYKFTSRLRTMPRKGYSIRGSRARANETVELNRAEIVNVLQQCGFIAYGYELYNKRHQCILRLQFARTYKGDPKIYRKQNYVKRALQANQYSVP